MLNRCLVVYPLVSQGILALCMIVSSLKKWILEMVVAEWDVVSMYLPLGTNSCACFLLAEVTNSLGEDWS